MLKSSRISCDVNIGDLLCVQDKKNCYIQLKGF